MDKNLKKYYIMFRVFLNSKKHLLHDTITAGLVILALYFAINSFVFPVLVMGSANAEKQAGNCEKAIGIYNIAQFYYKFNHFSDENQRAYFEIPYQKAVCYLKMNKQQESLSSILGGMTTIQVQYGIFAPETAYFMRKYLIDYYIKLGNLKLATQEYNSLLVIYKKIGYSYSELADMIRLSGDLHYQRGNYDLAIEFYKKAYNAMQKGRISDYEIFYNIVTRIANYETANKNYDITKKIYTTGINSLLNSGKENRSLTASMYLQYGDFLAQQKNTKEAIISYENAIELIQKLPARDNLKRSLGTYLLTLKELYNEGGRFDKVREIDLKIARKRRFSFYF